MVTSPLSNRDFIGVWANYMKEFETPTIMSYLQFLSRKRIHHHGHDFTKTLELDNQLDWEEQLMGFDTMPREIESVEQFLTNIEDRDIKMEGFKFLSQLVSPLDQLSKDQIPAAIKRMNLKQSIQDHLVQYSSIMKSTIVKSSGRQERGHLASKEDEEGHVATMKSNTNQGQGSVSQTPTTSLPKKFVPAPIKWYPLKGTMFCSRAPPYDFMKEITVGDNYLTCMLEKEPYYRYTATSDKCDKCTQAYKTQSGASHKPPCYNKQCTKCGLYGHSVRSCLQG
jgi:hypothetical protein